jgi:hypothetical protein
MRKSNFSILFVFFVIVNIAAALTSFLFLSNKKSFAVNKNEFRELEKGLNKIESSKKPTLLTPTDIAAELKQKTIPEQLSDLNYSHFLKKDKKFDVYLSFEIAGKMTDELQGKFNEYLTLKNINVENEIVEILKNGDFSKNLNEELFLFKKINLQNVENRILFEKFLSEIIALQKKDNNEMINQIVIESNSTYLNSISKSQQDNSKLIRNLFDAQNLEENKKRIIEIIKEKEPELSNELKKELGAD